MTGPRTVRKPRGHRRTLLVERMERRELLATLTVSNNGDTGGGTLRQAIMDANTNPGPDLITFDLAANELTILPQSPLPVLSDPGTLIDATRQPGWAGVPLVTIDGSMAGVNTVGFTLTGGNGGIKGLVIQNFQGAGGTGISISGGGRNVIQDDYIGVNASGTTAAANGGDGIDVSSGNNTIGGTTASQKNVISANTFQGILLEGNTATGNVVLGNDIGVGSDGKTPLGNGADGIITNGASGSVIGGSVAGAGNVISKNSSGIIIQGTGTTATSVQGNFIGTDSTGTIALGNTFDGLFVNGGGNNLIGGLGNARNVISGNGRTGITLQGASAKNNLVKGNDIGVASDGVSALGNATEGIAVNGAINAVIGGFSAAEGNVIAYNGSLFKNFGVNVLSGSSIAILSNRIYSNVGGGINISRGSNGDQVAPVLSLAQSGAGMVEITGRINTAPNTSYTIQFFSTSTPDASRKGQAEVYLGSTTVTTDPTGLATFDDRFAGLANVGQFITATATQSGTQNTSPFAIDVPITQAPLTDLSVSIATSPAGSLLFGGQETYTVTVTNAGPDPATGVQVTNTIDANSTYVSSTTDTGTVTQVGGVITATIGTLAAGATATITITVTANAPGTISIVSIVSGNEIDSNTSNNQATASVNILPGADLTVGINPAPNPVAVNGTLTYIVTVTNKGPSVAHDVVLTDDLPLSVINPSGTSNDGTVAQVGNIFTLVVSTLPVGGTATLTITGTPTVVGTITDTASATATEGNPVPGDATSSVDVVVARSADLTLTGTQSGTVALINQQVTYFFTVSNLGTSDATGAILTDTLPTNATFVSAHIVGGPDTGTVTGGVLTVNLPTILAGGSTTVAVIVKASSSVVLQNSAKVSNSVELDPNLGNNTFVSMPVYISPSDISVTLAPSSNPVFIGTPFNYTLTVTNHGPADTTSVIATETLPTSFTVGTITTTNGTATVTNGVLTATIAALASGQSAIITIPVTPTASGEFTSTATVDPNTTVQIDPNPANNTASTTVLVSPVDLAVVLNPSATTSLVGDDLVYILYVVNGGAAPATNAQVSGSLPANSRIVSATGGAGVTIGFSGNSYLATLGTIAPGTYRQITFVVVPTATGPLVATATATSDDFDQNPANNSTTTTTTAINVPGKLGLDQASYSVKENAGALTVTVNRVSGTQGQVAVAYVTSDGTAKAGVNYVYTAGVLIFNDGETSKTITIPILDDGVITKNLNFSLNLTAVAGGASLNPFASAASITVINTDVDLVPPEVAGVFPITDGRAIDALVIGFSKSLDPTTAGNLANYLVFTSGRDGRPGTGGHHVSILRAIYNDGNHTVTLIPARPLALNQFYGVAINGNTAGAITDVYGNVLDGDGNGTAGGNFGAYFAMGNNLTYLDASNNTVNLKLSGGGLMLLTRFTSGQANLLQLLGIAPGRSTLNGSVKPNRNSTNPTTTIAQATGFGTFGDIRSNLTTPPFYILQGGFSSPVATVAGAAAGQSASSITPRGPAAHSRKGR